MRDRRDTIRELRSAIDCLPVRTRRAMLEAIERNTIIAGAYVDRDGGVCPMLAAHRNGGRTNFITFARTWDRFTGARRARRATQRELGVLRGHLEASLLADEHIDLAGAIAEHRELVEARPQGEPMRRPDLEPRTRRWLRPFRREDEYDVALRIVEQERRALERV